MDLKNLVIVTILTFMASLPSAWGKDSGDYSSLKVGDVDEVEIDHLHPTQFDIGKIEEKDKREDFEGMKPKKLRKYLKEHPCPVIIGPGGVPYISDEQHRADAAEEAEDSHHAVKSLRKNGEATMYMKVIANYHDLSDAEFEKVMIAKHYTYLKDRGKLRKFKDLPDHVDKMGNDPYRSVAGFLADVSYKKVNVFFLQFKIAEWLREKLDMSDKDVTHELKKHKKKFLEKVGELLESKKAATQPWYSGHERCLANGVRRSISN
jgi:hypothetical protein